MIHKAKHIAGQVQQYTNLIKSRIYTPAAELSAKAWVTKEPVPFSQREQGEYTPFQVGQQWGELFDCAWFHLSGQVPQSGAGKKVVLMIDLGGEGCLYSPDGVPLRGITNIKSTFEPSLGMPGKRVVPLYEEARGGEMVDLWVDAGCNDLFGNLIDKGRIATLEIAYCNEKMRKLYYDIQVLYDLMESVEKESPRQYEILYSLQQALNCLGSFEEQELDNALRITGAELAKKGGHPVLSFGAVGHGHLDLAWLWPIRETKRKAARTFSTQLELIQRYPEYIFGASQPQAYEWIRQQHPALFEKIQEQVAKGRWETQGGMWVEADTNVPCGESLVRQFLYGKSYFKKHFHVDVNYLWLPDVFGFSGALPQIIKKSGCDYFYTMKLSWSQINTFPYHTFRWIGIDGSEVLTHMSPEGTYNSAALPHSIRKSAFAYKEKGMCEHALCVYGIGDGGGGPGPEHIERVRRMGDLNGLYPVRSTTAKKFFEAIGSDAGRYPGYKGELYLERHQGTLTTQGQTKRGNRRMEKALRNAELISAIALVQKGAEYPADKLEEIWKEVLLYQFHDIIPGSSIQRVYEESNQRYELLEQQTNAILQNALDALSKDGQQAFFNSLPWQRRITFQRDSTCYELELPALQAVAAEEAEPCEDIVSAQENCIENGILRAEFGADGFITSLVDKRTGRQFVPQGGAAGALTLFTDFGDAWDFAINYREKPTHVFSLVFRKVEQDGSVPVVVQRFEFGASWLEQRITLEPDGDCLHFSTTVEWNERNCMLRAEFPLDVQSDDIHCGIQFGHLRRSMLENTSLDYAQVEVVANRWLDWSDQQGGLAILCDEKYGYHAKNKRVSLNLLRSPDYPGKDADKGRHTFSYSLHVHDQPFELASVQKRASEVGTPALACGYFENPLQPVANQPSILLETVKQSEDKQGLILRYYESEGQPVQAEIQLPDHVIRCELVNLMEQNPQNLPITEGSVLLDFTAFEIHTLKIHYAKQP